jgi:hypothetical protein
MSEIKRFRGITRGLGRTVGVLAATVACGALAVGAAPEAAARPDPGGVRSCPEGSLRTSATETYAGAPVPVGEGRQNTTTVPLNGELVGIGCMKHTGGTATMQFRWYSSGRIQVGMFVYELIDCTSGQKHVRRMVYENGTTRTSDRAEATFKVNPSRKYRMRIGGDGSYDRPSRAPGELSGLTGYWTSFTPNASPKWQGETACA